MKKRLVSLILALVMLLSLSVAAYAGAGTGLEHEPISPPITIGSSG